MEPDEQSSHPNGNLDEEQGQPEQHRPLTNTVDSSSPSSSPPDNAETIDSDPSARPTANSDQHHRFSIAPSSFATDSTTALTSASMSATSLGHGHDAQVERADRAMAMRAQEGRAAVLLGNGLAATGHGRDGIDDAGAARDFSLESTAGTNADDDDPLTTPKQRHVGRMSAADGRESSSPSASPTRQRMAAKAGQPGSSPGDRDRIVLGAAVSGPSALSAPQRLGSLGNQARTASAPVAVARRDYSLGAGIGSSNNLSTTSRQRQVTGAGTSTATGSGAASNGFGSSSSAGAAAGAGAGAAGGGFKTMRSRARGMLGRMFGASNSGGSSSSGISSSTSSSGMAPSSLSKVNSNGLNISSPRDAQHVASGSFPRSASTVAAGVFAASAVNAARLPSEALVAEPTLRARSSRLTDPEDDVFSANATSTRPSPSVPQMGEFGLRRGSADKPLPPIRNYDDDDRANDAVKASTSRATGRLTSHHLRHSATDAADVDDVEERISTPVAETTANDIATPSRAQNGLTPASPSIADSTPVRRMREWTRSMENSIDGDGVERTLAMEIGLPTSSVRVNGDCDGAAVPTAPKATTTTTAAPRISPKRFPSGARKPVPAFSPIALGIDEDGRRTPTNSASVPQPRSASDNASHKPAPLVITPGRPRASTADSAQTAQEATTGFAWGAAAAAGAPSPVPRLVSPRRPSVEDKELLEAKKYADEFYNDDESHVGKEDMAQFLGGTRSISALTLKAYMEKFDFAGTPLVDAFRDLCSRLHLKAETQEIDRILEGFSARYFACNPKTIFGSAAAVHVVTGSFLLLNTDLHVADISTHMSRQQFVRLTLDTLHVNVDSPPRSESATPTPPSRAVSVYSTAESIGSGSNPHLSTSQSMSSLGAAKAWDTELEPVLREIYASVKAQQILLPTAAAFLAGRGLSSTSSASLYQTMRRHASTKSATSSQERLNAANKRVSVRGIPGLLSPASADGRASPAPSHYSSLDTTAPTLGFVSNLAHTVIREQDDETGSVASMASDSTVEDMDDDELALLGAPWAKEGNLQRKPYWDAPGKRSKDKAWAQYFVVIQKGDLHMFVFGESRGPRMPSGGLGGGNWLDNAKPIGEMNLSHALASALPPPGYSPTRPYCFSLTLPSGEMSFFQAGTEELVVEWVATCNYWAARRSRPPLPGGVSNVEYGWGPLTAAGSSLHLPRADSNATEELAESRSIMSNRSARSRFSIQPRRTFHNNGFGALADNMRIADWRAPQSSLIPSPLDEESQMESLRSHVATTKKQLEEHNALEPLIAPYYGTRSPNYHKTRANWLAKSRYLHTEVVKYEVYVDSLKQAINQRLKRQGEKKLEKSLARGAVIDEDDD